MVDYRFTISTQKLNLSAVFKSLVSDQSKIYFVALLAYLLAIFTLENKSNGKLSIIKHVTCVLEITAVKPFLRKPKGRRFYHRIHNLIFTVILYQRSRSKTLTQMQLKK